MRVAILSLFASLLLTGCSLSPTASLTPEQGVTIRGNVHGGQQPIVGAHVYLFAANTTGYGGNNIAASAANASVSLLNSGITGLSDSVGAYVLTAADGSFIITGDYTCTSGQQVYLYALGGNPGAGTNSASGLLALAGNCPAAGFFPATLQVWINEVSTVAAAYAFAGFATDATHVSSSGTARAKTGIANAFANANNLASITTGNALTTTPNGNGTVPRTRINTLANILASCVNSTGPASSPCTTLFANAKSAGSTGTTATDTATAAINIAHNPGSNIATLYNIPAPTIQFLPKLAAQPNDFTISLYFTGVSAGLNFSSGSSYTGVVDAAGNFWITDPNSSALSEFSPLGVPISTSNGYTGGGLFQPFLLSIDAVSGGVWTENLSSPPTLSKFTSTGSPITGNSGITTDGYGPIANDAAANLWLSIFGEVEKFSSSGTLLSPSGGYLDGAMTGPGGIGVDGSANVWVAESNSLVKLSNSGTILSPANTGYTGGGLVQPAGLAIDKSGNIWIANNNNTISKFNNSGVAQSTSAGYTGGGLGTAGTPSIPAAIAVDGDGNVWTANGQNNFSEFTSAGAAISPSTGYIASSPSSGNSGPYVCAPDASGNLWIAIFDSPGNGFVGQFIGISAPVITPIAAGLPTTPTGNGTSSLGTRP